MYEISIRHEPALHLAALPHQGAYAGIGATFNRLQAWAAGRGLLAGQPRFFGLYYDDPSSVPAARLRSEAALLAPVGTPVEDGMRLIDLPPARLAMLVFKGPYAELESAYAWLYRDWLPDSGEEPADAPVREEYLNDCRGLPPSEWLTALMLPLRERVRA